MELGRLGVPQTPPALGATVEEPRLKSIARLSSQAREDLSFARKASGGERADRLERLLSPLGPDGLDGWSDCAGELKHSGSDARSRRCSRNAGDRNGDERRLDGAAGRGLP